MVGTASGIIPEVMDLNTAAVVFMGGYVVVIAVAGLLMSIRPGAGTRPLLLTTAAADAASGCSQAILLGGEAEVLGNFRGRVQSVLLGARSGKLEELLLASGGGVLEGGRVPAAAILSSDGELLQIGEPSAEPATDGPVDSITLQRDAAVISLEGKRLGKLRMVCFEPETHRVTGLVVVAGWRAGRTVRIPIGRIRAAGVERITTDIRAQDWAGLQGFASDRAIRDAVLERLTDDETTRTLARSITVQVEDQQVLLRGYVRTQAQAEQAAAVTRSVPGVLAVDRGIRTDEDLVRAVREAIGRDLGAAATDLEVRSEFGQIDIAGRVRDRQALRRIDAVARQVPGVLVTHNFATVG